MLAHQEIASKLQAQGAHQESLIGELQSRLTDFSTLPLQTKQLEEANQPAETRLGQVEEHLQELKEDTSKDFESLKEMQD